VRQRTETDRLRLAVEAGAEVTRALAVADAPTVIARHVARALDVWECSLYEHDPASRTLTAAAVWSQDPTPEDEAWVGARLSLDERPGYAAIIDGGETVISRAGDPSMDSVDSAVMQEWGERESLAVPLRFRDLGVVGCLVLIEKREGRSFTEEDVELVTQLAGPVAVAVRNARLFRLQQEQNRYLSSLLETGSAITTSITLEDSLARICRTAAGSLETGECIIYEYDPAQDVIIRRAFFSAGDMPPPRGAGGVCPLEASPSDRRLLEGGRVMQQALADADLPSDARASMERWGEKARLRVPLIVEGEPLGILALVESRRDRIFDAGEVELAQALGEQAATAIRHARLFRRGERQNKRLAALLETSRVLCSSLDVGAVLGEVRREVAGLFDVPGDRISLLLRRGESFVPFVATGRTPTHDDDQPPVELDTLLRRAADDLVPAAAGDGTRLVVPFVSGETANGLLDLRSAGLVIGADELELLQILAGQAAAALANAALYRTLERQAITDGLTGLYNHRYFYERLNQEIARAQRYGLPLSLLMIDIDDFKHFNDRFGHPAGDLVLAEVGRILTTHIRTGVDIASRYGGEEFTIVLPNTARDGAHVVGTRLAEHLAALPGAPPRGEGAVQVGESIRVTVSNAALPGADAETHITVSIGVACFPGAAGGPGELVRNADKALYLAKRLGKNRVEVFGD
jgi:diguanylate cyclase (GGDEF)-like protein